MKSYETAIIGGGASGLFCAALLAQKGRKNIILLERNDRLGKKLSATGNGQGNITNTDLSKTHYYSDDREKVGRILNKFDNAAVVDFFESLGGLFESDEKGRVYPASRQASSVTDLLRGYVDKSGITVRTGAFVDKLAFNGAKFVLSCGEESIFADKVILCAGGKAQKNFGSDGNGYALASAFSHSVTPLYPSLVQIKTDTADIKTLKGIRADVVLTARDRGKILGKSRGDVIFTEYGISGNAVFYLSPLLSDKRDGEISIEFLPDVKSEKLVSLIRNKMKSRSDVARGEILGCILNNQIGRTIMKRVKGDSAEEIVSVIKNFTLGYKGTLGFDSAQVTKGGIPLGETTENLESIKRGGLFFCGEILNVDGDCGGYNLQWAFSSAYAAVGGIIK